MFEPLAENSLSAALLRLCCCF